jgi:peptide deformylase
MAILTIRKIGDSVLEKPCREISNPQRYRRLIKDMIETAAYHGAAGLAANQVGANVRIFVMSQEKGYLPIINPEFEPITQTQEVKDEGCLSVPRIGAKIKRYTDIAITYLTPNGDKVIAKTVNLGARIFQHEVQHLNGELFLQNAENIYYIK